MVPQLESVGSERQSVAGASKRLVLTVAGVLAIGWCWFAYSALSGESAQLERPSSHEHEEGPHGDAASPPAVPSPTSAELSRNRVQSSTLVLIVRDEAGHLIAGASVARCSAAGGRNLSVKDRVGITDSAGELCIPLADAVTMDQGQLVVTARGLVAKSIDCPRSPGCYDVTLQAGAELQIQCHDFTGLPLPHIDVAISMVLFPASVWRDTVPDDRQVGSDAVTTIRFGQSDAHGAVVFDGLLPGTYFVRAESESHLLAATDNGKMAIDVVGGTSRQVLVCGKVCVAALETNVPTADILDYGIVADRSHVTTGVSQEALDLRRREIERRFPSCQVAVSVAKGGAEGLGQASFRYSTVGYGDIVHDVPFVEMASFVRPATFLAAAVARQPSGKVVLRVEGDYGVSRRKLRAELKRTMRSVSGIPCVEGEEKTVPATSYVVDIMDRELAKAIETPEAVVVPEQGRVEVALRIRDGLVPVTVGVDIPAILSGQIATITISAPGRRTSKGRTLGGPWVTWVPAGVYDVTVEAGGCKTASATLVAAVGQATSISLTLETQ